MTDYTSRGVKCWLFTCSRSKVKLELIPNGMDAKEAGTVNWDKANLMNTQSSLLYIIQQTWNFEMTQNTCRQSLVRPVLHPDVTTESAVLLIFNQRLDWWWATSVPLCERCISVKQEKLKLPFSNKTTTESDLNRFVWCVCDRWLGPPVSSDTINISEGPGAANGPPHSYTFNRKLKYVSNKLSDWCVLGIGCLFIKMAPPCSLGLWETWKSHQSAFHRQIKVWNIQIKKIYIQKQLVKSVQGAICPEVSICGGRWRLGNIFGGSLLLLAESLTKSESIILNLDKYKPARCWHNKLLSHWKTVTEEVTHFRERWCLKRHIYSKFLEHKIRFSPAQISCVNILNCELLTLVVDSFLRDSSMYKHPKEVQRGRSHGLNSTVHPFTACALKKT